MLPYRLGRPGSAPATGCASTRSRGAPENGLLPDSALLRARSILGLAELVVCLARPGAMLVFIAISRRVNPGRFTEYA